MLSPRVSLRRRRSGSVEMGSLSALAEADGIDNESCCSDIEHGVPGERGDDEPTAGNLEIRPFLSRPRDFSDSSSSFASRDEDRDGARLNQKGPSSASSVKSTLPATPPSSTSNHNKWLRKTFARSSSGGASGSDASDARGTYSPALAAGHANNHRSVRSKRRRRRGCTNGSGSCRRRVLSAALCLGSGLLAFNVLWKAYWLSGCTDGAYEKAAAAVGSNGPEQMHLAYSGVDAKGNPTGMTVMWTTAQGEAPPVVQYGLSRDALDFSVNGTSVRYLDTVHHRASLEDLAPGTRIFYRCGNPPLSNADNEESSALNRSLTLDAFIMASGAGGKSVQDSDAPASGPDRSIDRGKWSGVSSFLTAPEPERYSGDGPWDRPVSVAVVGDFGLVNAGLTFDRLHQLAEDEEIDFVLHLGDIAYADDAYLERPWSFGYEEKWDAFMRRASHDFGTKVPYMVVPGNHEAECHSPACLFSKRRLRSLSHFNAYNSRFRMPSLESGADHGTAMWYSFNVGPVHFVVINTETDFPGAPGDHFTWSGGDGNGGFGDQMTWLEEDLARANKERGVRPWIVVSGHRPLYSKENLRRSGQQDKHSERIRKVFEPLLQKYKADVYLAGHVHSFERSFPVFDTEVRLAGRDNGEERSLPEASANMLYDDPAAPVHLVNGAGGNIEGFKASRTFFKKAVPQWHAISMGKVAGVGILSFPSMGEMKSTFVTSDSPAQVLDELTIRHHR